jgi:HopA1 effector protein family
MNGCWDEMAQVAASLRFHSASGFTVLGQKHESPDQGTTQADSVLTGDALTAMTDILYSVLHCREPSEPSLLAGFSDWVGARDFALSLSEANQGQGSWESGWLIRGAENGSVIAERNGLRFWVRPEDVRAPGPLTDGVSASVKLPKEFRHMLPGFYFAVGDAEHDGNLPDAVRVYWHLRPVGAAPLVALITGRLNVAGIPFRLKLVSDPLGYRRSDPAVLYLPRSSYGKAAPLLAQLYAEVRQFLRSPVSAYVKRMAYGVGLAEDPNDGSSFGQHRSRLLATALASPASAGAASAGDRLDAVVAALEANGFEPAALHLNPGSSDGYEPFEPES